MERKTAISIDVVTVEQVKARLSYTHSLEPQEERALRMRLGVTLPLKAPLARAAPEGSELAEELLLMEMDLLNAHRSKTHPRASPVRNLMASPTKSKIVRALRKKK